MSVLDFQLQKCGSCCQKCVTICTTSCSTSLYCSWFSSCLTQQKWKGKDSNTLGIQGVKVTKTIACFTQGNQRNCIKASENGWGYKDNAKNNTSKTQWAIQTKENDYVLKVRHTSTNSTVRIITLTYRHCDWKLTHFCVKIAHE